MLNPIPGTFAGVDLSQAYWARGKNNGSVDGYVIKFGAKMKCGQADVQCDYRKNYFKSTKPTSGIFLPLEKAVKRATPSTPNAPSLSSFNVGGRIPSNNKPSFSQSVGPGARAASPAAKPALRRPSLPRPASPLRQQPAAVNTPSRPSVAGFSKSRIGSGPRFTPAKTFNPGASLRNGTSTPSKQLGPEPAFDDSPEVEVTPTPPPIGVARTLDDAAQEGETRRLRTQLEEKERQLREQAAALTEMEKSLTELQSFLPSDGQPEKQSNNAVKEPSDVAQLRAMLREKNDKIAILTAEFDAHRADFRSTIDTLEMASTETERVYEKRVDELLQEIRELQDRGEDVQSVALQLKQLEELVQELEEGLEDARRGEAEARGEVEHLRGEVERGRTELKHEKEKAAQALRSGSAGGSRDSKHIKELEAKDDEIRGLKAIIHSLNRESVLSPGGTLHSSPRVNGNVEEANKDHAEPTTELERKVKELQDMIERKANREEELERELERMRTTLILEGPGKTVAGDNRLSDRTIVPVDWRNTNGSRQPLATMQEDAVSEVSKASTLRCELCEEQGHDILNCTNVFSSRPVGSQDRSSQLRTGKDVVAEGLRGISLIPPSHNRNDSASVRPLSPRKESTPLAQQSGGFSMADPTTPKAGPAVLRASADEEKWCAVCDSEEHNTMECPYEDTM